MDRAYLRVVPLPAGLTPADFYAAMEAATAETPIVLHSGRPLKEVVQANIMSGVVSNLFTVILKETVSGITKPVSDTNYPDLNVQGIPDAAGITPADLPMEIKATTKPLKGGEGHNGHAGWTVVASYVLDEKGNLDFLTLSVAYLEAPPTDWVYLGSKVKEATGTQRTETYITTPSGTAKLRDGLVYWDPRVTISKSMRSARRRVIVVAIPPHSPFYE